MIFLFTDFGSNGPYLGQMQFVLRKVAPNVEVINLISDAPRGNPRASSYLLAAISGFFPPDSIFLCVVDPGVGGERRPLVLNADGKWFVGPDNGLLNIVARYSKQTQWWEITWKPPFLSATFHGRDLFAPIAAQIATNDDTSGLEPSTGPDLSQSQMNIAETVYVDRYGNVMTGIRYNEGLEGKTLEIKNHSVSQSKTFCSVPDGSAFWFKNSNGLIEIAVNNSSADQVLGLAVGDRFRFL